MSRAKDNKSSKKKDSNSTSQNQSLGISNTQQSTSPNQGTPTSSTTSLNDSRNKSPDNASPAGTPSAGAPHPGTPVQHYIPQPGAAGQPVSNGPGTPNRQGQPAAPSVVISPSAPVSGIASHFGHCLLLLTTGFYSMSPLLAPPKRCPEISRLLGSLMSSTAYRRLLRTCRKVSGLPSANIHRDSTSPISVRENWKSCRDSTKCLQTGAKICSCKRSTSATSSSISTTRRLI